MKNSDTGGSLEFSWVFLVSIRSSDGTDFSLTLCLYADNLTPFRTGSFFDSDRSNVASPVFHVYLFLSSSPSEVSPAYF